MNIALSLFALALLAADAPPPPAPVKPSISLGNFVVQAAPPAASMSSPVVFQFQVIEMTGLDWRATNQAKLTSATSREGMSVWTAPASLVPELVKAAGATPTRVKMVADYEKFVHFRQNSDSKMRVSGISQETSLPKMEKTREGIAATLTGRKLDQGVLTKLVIEETRVLAMHKVPVADSSNAPKDGALRQVSIPEVAGADVAGEWLIPRDGVLIVSLGVHTVADADSKAVVKERLALIEANPPAFKLGDIESRGDSLVKGQLHSISVTRQEMPAAIPLPFASVPSRSLPEPRDAQGKPVELPPLPETVPPPTAFSPSSEPCASPQAAHVKAPELMVDKVIDPALKAVGFDMMCTDGLDSESSCSDDAKAEPKVSEVKIGPFRAWSFRLPGKGVSSVEIRGIVLPLPSPAVRAIVMPKTN